MDLHQLSLSFVSKNSMCFQMFRTSICHLLIESGGSNYYERQCTKSLQISSSAGRIFYIKNIPLNHKRIFLNPKRIPMNPNRFNRHVNFVFDGQCCILEIYRKTPWKYPIMFIDLVAEVASRITDHASAIALMSIDKMTHAALRPTREARHRRMRFDNARRAIGLDLARKYKSYSVTNGGGAIVFSSWIDGKHFLRGVLSSTTFNICIIKNVTVFRPDYDPVLHDHFLRDHLLCMCLVKGESVTDVHFDMCTHETITSSRHRETFLCVPRGAYSKEA
jgi:hypothetical protein